MKNGKFSQKLKKGFTLVELVVAIAVFAIFSVGAAVVLVPVLNIYNSAIQLSDAQFVASNVLDAVENELAYAQPDQAPVISGDGTEIRFNGIYPDTRLKSTGGYLYIARGAGGEFQPYYDERYYRSGRVEVTFAGPEEGARAYTVTVEVKKDSGEALYTATGNITPLAYAGSGV